jgi:hypothetical protein
MRMAIAAARAAMLTGLAGSVADLLPAVASAAVDSDATGHGAKNPTRRPPQNLSQCHNDRQQRRSHAVSRPRPNTLPESEPTMKITMLAALAIVTAAATLPMAAVAHADTEYDFLSPSGNINCSMSLQSDFVQDGVTQTGSNYVQCELSDYTWQLPHACPSKVVGVAFRSDDTAPPVAGCWKFPNQLPLPWPTLNYGQTRTVGAITCESEPSGVTCTNSNTGHFFRVSRDSYDVG